MNDLVFVKGNDIFTDSLVIAKGTENEHRAVRATIRKYEKEISQLGRLLFKIATLETKGDNEE